VVYKGVDRETNIYPGPKTLKINHRASGGVFQVHIQNVHRFLRPKQLFLKFRKFWNSLGGFHLKLKF